MCSRLKVGGPTQAYLRNNEKSHRHPVLQIELMAPVSYCMLARGKLGMDIGIRGELTVSVTSRPGE